MIRIFSRRPLLSEVKDRESAAKYLFGEDYTGAADQESKINRMLNNLDRNFRFGDVYQVGNSERVVLYLTDDDVLVKSLGDWKGGLFGCFDYNRTNKLLPSSYRKCEFLPRDPSSYDYLGNLTENSVLVSKDHPSLSEWSHDDAEMEALIHKSLEVYSLLKCFHLYGVRKEGSDRRIEPLEL